MPRSDDRPEFGSAQNETVRIAYFFFVLPEPLRLPHGHVIESIVHPTLEEVREVLSAEGARDADLLELRPVASLRVWQTTLPVQVLVDYQNAGVFEVVEQAFPPVASAPVEAESNDSGDLPRTVLEAAVTMDPASADPSSEAFDRALEAVQAVQRAYLLATREPLTLLTQENAPFLVPMAVREVSPSEDRWPQGFSLFVPNTSLYSWTLGDPLSGGETQALAATFEGRVSRSFAAYAELKWEARNALYLRGDYRAAVMLSHSASETFFNALLMHMLWEENRDPAEAAQAYFAGQGLTERLRRHYHERLGGNWSVIGRNELGRWARELAAVRHEVIHAAYRPTRKEAYAAYECLDSVDRFLISRLTHDKTLRRYPRTVFALLGRVGLEDRGAWNRRLEQLVHDPEEPVWIETFERWRWVLRDALRETDDDATDASEVAAVLLFRHDAPPQWYEHDRHRRRVRPTEPPPDLAPAAAATMRATEEAFLAETRSGERGTVLWPGRPGRPVKGAEWVRDYTVLPLYGVMCDGSDFRS
jgi:hypothetical protein